MTHFDWKLLRRKKVIPADRRVAEKEETWTLTPESEEASMRPDESAHKASDRDNKIDASKSKSADSDAEPNLSRGHETRKSKGRRVKSYLKKCKGALSKGDDGSVERKRGSCWFVDDAADKGAAEKESVDEAEIADDRQSVYEDARDFAADQPHDGTLDKCDSSDTLIAETQEEPVEDNNIDCSRSDSTAHDDTEQTTEEFNLAVVAASGARGDVASLVRNFLGPIYGEGVLDLLTRQARDILVCAYHGNLDNFVKSYLSPAAGLLAEIKRFASQKGNEFIVPSGWPLTLGTGGLVLHLGELEASALRLGECYLCVRSAAATATAIATALTVKTADSIEKDTVEVALVWRASSMRTVGFLGWDREDELMDWRDPSSKVASASSSSNSHSDSSGSFKWRRRRRSREEPRGPRSRDNSDDKFKRHESKSSERLQLSRTAEVLPEEESRFRRFVVKSRSSSSVTDVWKRSESKCCEERRSTSTGRCSKKSSLEVEQEEQTELKNDDAKVKNVASPTTMEKWKEAARSDTRCKILGAEDLKSPACLENVVCEATRTSRETSTDRSEVVLHPDQVTDDELPAYIDTLLVTVERKIERVSLDDLTFPCIVCRNIDIDDPLLGCKCAGESCECGTESCACLANAEAKLEEAARSFEVPGIKHIDSDDEEEVRMAFGAKKRNDAEVTTPRTIHDIPERVLESGLTLPGYTDIRGRLVLEYKSDSTRTGALSARELAPYFLYLGRLPSADSTKDGFTLLLREDTTKEEMLLLDRALFLLQNKVNIPQILLVQSPSRNTSDLFIRSRLEIVSIDQTTLDLYVTNRDTNYNHEQWVAFFKEYDSMMIEWQAAGRRLALEMSELRECSSLSGTLTPLGRLLTDPTLKKTARDAEEAMATLEERASSLLHIEYVRLSLKRARRLMREVGNAATRLESSFESRRATIRNLAVLRSIEDQAREVLSWLCKKGEDILSKHALHTATNLATAKLHEREFEKFYFTSMRHLDKGNDLAEAASSSGLRELARSLKHHLRGFGSRLEDRREYLEDTSRCCLLQDRAYEWAQEAKMAGERRAQQFLMARPPLPPEHFAEMIALAEKLGNEVLLEQCRVARSKCQEALDFARISSAPGSPARRRSYATSDSTTSWDDSLLKRTSWEDSDSGASYIGPMDSVGSSNNGRQALDDIAELRESAEQLLDGSPPRTPPRSPGPRRLSKPPVNSHLHRAPSIAPGMKAKKTILLIMREMIQTERDYVKSLEYIIENYIPELVREDIPQSLRGQRNVIFGNVEKIYEFHSQDFLRELEQCEQSPIMVGQCFLRHEKKFYLYALYNKNKPNSDSLMAEYGSKFFKAKQIELGDKMDLASYLLKPVQRMGKYALLLQQLVKAGTDLSEQLSDEKDPDERPTFEGEADLRAAEQMVRFQLRHGNDLLAMDSLRDCDVNVKEQGRLLRQNEFLVWQGKGKKCLRQVFLFEDLILFSKARRFPDRKNLDIYIYKHSIKTTDIGLTAVIADSPTKFEIWFRKRKPGDTYTLQCASEEIKKAWTEELSNLLWKQALRNREVRLAEMSSMGIGNKPCLDIRPSADQISDRSISVAQLSKTPRFRNSIAVSVSEDSGRCSRRPHSVISVSSSSSSGGSSGPPTTLNLGLDTSPRPHHRSTTLNSQCSVESGIIADISIISDDGGDSSDRSHWNSTLESPTSPLPSASTPLQSPMSSTATSTTSPSSSEANLTPYDHDMSINL